MPHVSVTLIGAEPDADGRDRLLGRVTDAMVEQLARTRGLVLASLTTAQRADWRIGGAAIGPNAVGAQVVATLPAGSVSHGQKAAFAAAVEKAVAECLGGIDLPLYCVVQEVPRASFGYNGQLLSPPGA